MSQLRWILPTDPPDAFPPVDEALDRPNGLLAAGGDLSVDRLLAAYRRGIFPWFEDGQEILWWTPDPRTVLWPAEVHLSRSTRRTLRRLQPRIALNTAFDEVVSACAEPRINQSGTWITAAMKTAYIDLHRRGYAHSLEIWDGDQLAGGIYGVGLGGVFFGESMFSRITDASKIAIAALARWLHRWDFAVIDGQIKSAHLVALGSHEIPRAQFTGILNEHCRREVLNAVWERCENLTINWQ